jgi:hypothetical protein
MEQINRGKALRLLKPTRRAAKVDTAESCGQTRKQRVEKNVQRGAVMSNNKQSSVEWLIKQLIFKTEFEDLPNQYVLMSDKDIDSIIDKAKAMHKQEIIETHFNAQPFNATMLHNAEKYYNETFGGNNDNTLRRGTDNN